MSPKVSVVVPVYNTQEYLRRCLESIICQTLQDIEIIVVNDLTPDRSQEIINEYQKKDHRVSSISHRENLGSGGARNSGLEAARSSYIQFVDSDDYIHPQMCAQLYELAEATGAGLVHCGCSLVYSTTLPNHIIVGDREYYRIKKQGLDLTGNTLPLDADVSCWNKLFRRELLEQYQLRFPERILIAEDAYFAMAYWSICGSVCYYPEALYFYERKAGSIMTETFAGNQGLKVLDHLHIVHLFYDFLQRHGLFIRYQKSFWKFYIGYLHLCLHYAGSGDVYKSAFELAHDFLQGKDSVEGKVLQAVQNLDYPEYVWQELQRIQRDREQVQNNRWYRFGRLSRKRKFWIMGTWLARRLRLYPILRPFSAFLRRHKI